MTTLPLMVLRSTDGEELYSGRARSIRHLLIEAVQKKIPLPRVDLYGCNLERAPLGGAIMPEARLIAHGSTPAEAWEAIPDIEHIEFWGLMKLLQGRIPMRPNRPAATGFQPDTDTDLQTQTRDRQMTIHRLYKTDGGLIFEHECGSQRECVEEAVRQGVDLTDVNLSGADLRGAQIPRAHMPGADLRWANLERAILRGANMRGVVLRWANLERANLDAANLQGVNPDEINLDETQLDEVYIPGANLRD